MNRTENAIKNTKYALLSKLVTLLLNFLSRTVFIKILGDTYLGVNGLYTEVLTALSFAELGFGNALTFAMYAPVAKGEKEHIKQLLSYYKKVYRIIAGIVLILGIVLIPLLPYIVKGADFITNDELKLYFCIYLANTVISYFVSYKFSYLNALQKRYEITKIELILNSSITIVQIVIILLLKSFLGYLLAHTIMLLISRVYISYYLNRKYRILEEKPEKNISKEEKKSILHEVKGLVVHQFSSVAVHQTDNIIISSLSGLGVVAVGLVSNYNLIMTAVLGFTEQIFTSITPGFGNLVAASDREHFKHVFNIANFINFWIYGFCSIAFFTLIPAFITLWIGEDKLIDIGSFALIILNCYLMGQCIVYNNARNAIGNFNKDKWWALTQAVVNLVVSIWGAKQFGLIGVYIGTVVSRLVYVIFRPFSTYSLMFNSSSKEYYIKTITYLLSVVAVGCVTYIITSSILVKVSIIRLIIASLVVALIPNFLFFLLYFRTKEFSESVNRARMIIKRN